MSVLAKVLPSLSSLETLVFMHDADAPGGDLDVFFPPAFWKSFAELSSAPNLKTIGIELPNSIDFSSFEDDESQAKLHKMIQESFRKFWKNAKSLEKVAFRTLPESVTDDDILKGFFDQGDEGSNNNNQQPRLLLVPEQVTHFNIGRCANISGVSLVPLVTAIGAFQQLVELDLKHILALKEEDMLLMTANLPSVQTLEVASAMEITGSFLKRNVAALGQNLVELVMDNTGLTEEAIGDVFEKNYIKLRKVHFPNSSCLVGGKSLLGLARHGGNLSMDLSFCPKLDEEVVKKLTEAGLSCLL
jgi:hypothetical protein